jgi:hypothetical protein
MRKNKYSFNFKFNRNNQIKEKGSTRIGESLKTLGNLNSLHIDLK